MIDSVIFDIILFILIGLGVAYMGVALMRPGSNSEVPWGLFLIGVFGAIAGGLLAPVVGIFSTPFAFAGSIIFAFLLAVGLVWLFGLIMLLFLPDDAVYASGPAYQMVGAKGGRALPIRNDHEVRVDVGRQLEWDSRTQGQTINVSVDKSEVLLTGTVTTFDALDAAGVIAATTPGVVAVDNQLKISAPNVIAADKTLLEDTVDTILELNSEIDSRHIKVSARDHGAVIIKGIVSSLWQKTKVESLVSSIKGVTRIDNQIKVTPAITVKDEEIKRRIVTRLRNYTLAEPEEIDINVNQGMVNISGSLPVWTNWQQVINTIAYTDGVRAITDNLRVR